jgi:hypothetical protein
VVVGGRGVRAAGRGGGKGASGVKRGFGEQGRSERSTRDGVGVVTKKIQEREMSGGAAGKKRRLGLQD